MDDEALNRARLRLDTFSDRITFVKDNFANLKKILLEHNVDQIDGLVADLGISTLQISSAQKGFSFGISGPLSMKMDPSSTVDADYIVNKYSEQQLWRIIKEYGEEKHARYIAREIVNSRRISKIETTGELADIIRKCVPKQHVVKSLARVFQAIRIKVNEELLNLRQLLPQATDFLRIGGRLAIISYHSLEDRIVKNYFKEQEKPCTCPPDFPHCICGKQPRFKILARLIRPGLQELEENPAARSARLRIAEKRSD